MQIALKRPCAFFSIGDVHDKKLPFKTLGAGYSIVFIIFNV